MRKLLALAALVAVVILVIWFVLHGSGGTTTKAVTTLLPRDTLAFAYVPDVNRARAQWRGTNLYKLWREPAVQKFLQKPLSKSPKKHAASQRLAEIEKIGMKSVFVAVTSWRDNEMQFAGGFRFNGNRAEAERVVRHFREPLWRRLGSGQPETITYEKRSIEVVRNERELWASVYADDWFLISNDLAQVQMMLDRVDGRTVDQSATLAVDDDFRAALRQMPPKYASLVYLRADRLTERLGPEKGAALKKIRAACASLEFDRGRMRDTLYLGMPRMADADEMKGVALPLASVDTFLFATSLLNPDKEMPLSMPGGHTSSRLLAGALGAVAATGVTVDDWKAAFGQETGVLGEWPASSQWPGLIAVLPVKNRPKAEALLEAISKSSPAAQWQKEQKNGVTYHTMQTGGRFFSFSPTVALSDRLLVIAQNRQTVDAALERSGGVGGLTGSKNFKTAERAVPKADTAFIYLDPALFYRKLDAAVRPILLMGAAFVPALNENVDLTLLPEPDVMARHLTPIALSQRYTKSGYVVESVGPLTACQGLLVTAILTGGGATLYQRAKAGGGLLPVPMGVFGTPAAAGSPSPSPTPDPPP